MGSTARRMSFLLHLSPFQSIPGGDSVNIEGGYVNTLPNGS